MSVEHKNVKVNSKNRNLESLHFIIIIIIIIIMPFQYRRCYDMIGNDGDTKDLH